MESSSKIPEWRRAAMPSLPSNRFKPQNSSKRRTQIEEEETRDDVLQQKIPIEVQERSSSPRKTGLTPETSLDSLGFDVWFLISCYLPKSALVSICQTSPRMYSIIIPVLYNTIDLSVHAPPDGVTVSFIYRRRTCEQQYMFLRQILRKPECGQHVRSLKWTLGLEDEKLGFKPKYLQGERIMWRTGDREKVFEYLDKVVSLDIDSATKNGGVIDEGKDLFPAAQRVHLRGTSLASSILYGSGKAPLSTLQLGPYRITRPDPSRLTGTASPSSSSSSAPPQPPQASKYPNLLHPAFHLRCKNLHTLSLNLQLSDTRPEIEDFYTSLAAFLPDIRPRCFIFTLVGMNGQPIPQPSFRRRGEECGTRRKMLRNGRSRNMGWSCVSSITQANIVPENFRDILLPVLIQGWNGLQRLELRGVMWTLLDETRKALKERGVVLEGDGWQNEVDVSEDED